MKLYRDENNNNTHTQNLITIGNITVPKYNSLSNVSNTTLDEGKIVYTKDNQTLYYHDETAWNILSSNTGDYVTLSDAGTGIYGLTVDGQGPSLSVKSLDAGDGISITEDANVLSINVKSGLILSTSGNTNSLLDAFQRVRVSNPITLFESSMDLSPKNLIWNANTVGIANLVYANGTSSLDLNVFNTNEEAVRQSVQYSRYQPGKSLLIMTTGVFGVAQTGITRRVGYFDRDDGIFLEQTETDVAWVIRSNVSGTITDNRVSQTSWNIDTFNGSGASGITLDLSTSILSLCDIEWLAVGSVRTGFIFRNTIYYAHQFTNEGNIGAYMRRASLPIRYEISSDGTAVSSASLKQICSTVISEGGFTPRGYIRSVSNGTTAVSTNSSTYTVILALRFKQKFAIGSIIPIQVNGFVTGGGGATIHMIMLFRTITTGGTWISSSTATEYNVTASGYSGGYSILEGHLTQNINLNVNLEANDLVVGSDYDGNPYEIVVVAKSFSGTPSVVATLVYREIY